MGWCRCRLRRLCGITCFRVCDDGGFLAHGGKGKRYSDTKADWKLRESRIEDRWAEVRPEMTKTPPSRVLVAAIFKVVPFQVEAADEVPEGGLFWLGGCSLLETPANVAVSNDLVGLMRWKGHTLGYRSTRCLNCPLSSSCGHDDCSTRSRYAFGIVVRFR